MGGATTTTSVGLIATTGVTLSHMHSELGGSQNVHG